MLWLLTLHIIRKLKFSFKLLLIFGNIQMDAKTVSSAGRSNRISKDHYSKVKNSLSKKRVHHAINQSMCRISEVMSHLVSSKQCTKESALCIDFRSC